MALSLAASRTDLPLIETLPLLASERPATTLSRVDLPQPLGPISETNSPFLIVSDTPLRTVTLASSPPKLLVTLLTCTPISSGCAMLWM